MINGRGWSRIDWESPDAAARITGGSSRLPYQITRTGSPWRDMPEFFGNWNSVYTRFRDWTYT
jgi:hypothetical protein